MNYMKMKLLCASLILPILVGLGSITSAANESNPTVCPPGITTQIRHFKDYGSSPFILAEDHEQSTFALDVDRASYDVARLWLNNARRPNPSSVRPEEFVNALTYRYPLPSHGISLVLDGVQAHPFAGENSLGLLRVVMQAAENPVRPPMTIIFCLDRSGSMQETTGLAGQHDVKFNLALETIQLLADYLPEGDRLGLVSYADDFSIDLETASTSSLKNSLPFTLLNLQAGGSTNLYAGLHQAFILAAKEKEQRPDQEVAVILLSDGAANQGIVNVQEMLDWTESFRELGIRLSTIGIGFETLNDEILEQLGDKGDGQYIFLGIPGDLERVLNTAMSHLLPVALEARSQVQFNPEAVKAWRQIGFENRGLPDEAFRDNTTDAGEVGSGQSVTVLYEIELAGDNGETLDPSSLIAKALVRWKDLEGEWSESSVEIRMKDLQEGEMDARFRTAASMARWAQLIRREDDWDSVLYANAYAQLMEFTSAIETSMPGDLNELKEQISEVRDLMSLDFELGALE